MIVSPSFATTKDSTAGSLSGTSILANQESTSDYYQERPKQVARVASEMADLLIGRRPAWDMSVHSSFFTRITEESNHHLLARKHHEYIRQLPTELLIDIFSRLPIRDLKRAELTCRRFRAIVSVPANVDTFLKARQREARARLHEKATHLMFRGFVEQQDGDFLSTFSNFVNRGGMSQDLSRYVYVQTAMLDLFKQNLKNLSSDVLQGTSEAELERDVMRLLHYMLQIHITKHMPLAPDIPCDICQTSGLGVDKFITRAWSPNLDRLGFTQTSLRNWYEKLANPVVEIHNDCTGRTHVPGSSLLCTVTSISEPPTNLVTHLIWHEDTPNSEYAWSLPSGPVRVGLCSMSELKDLLDVPDLPTKNAFRAIGPYAPTPDSGDKLSAYFFAYYVKNEWASGLMKQALGGTARDKFVKTAMMEELDIY